MMPKICVSPDRVLPGSWRVEALDSNGDGLLAVTIFAGFDAKRFAAEYARRLRARLQQPPIGGCQPGQRASVGVSGLGQRSTRSPLAIR